MVREAAEIRSQDIADVYELAVLDSQGVRIGVIVGACGGRPGRAEWLRVRLGLFGLRVVAIPLRDAVVEDGAVRVPHSREHVWNAPSLDHHMVSERVAATVRRHYAGGVQPVAAL
jgi:hypothetical protein